MLMAIGASLLVSCQLCAGISDYIGGKFLTPAQKTQLLAYSGRNPVTKLERNTLIVKLDIENGTGINHYTAQSYLNFQGGTVQAALNDVDSRLAYIYSPQFKVLTPELVALIQQRVDVMYNIHTYGPR